MREIIIGLLICLVVAAVSRQLLRIEHSMGINIKVTIMKMNSISKLALLLFLSISISACGGNKKAAPQDGAENVADITLPPVVEKDVAPAEATVADGETVSFDEWRKRREAQKQTLEQDQ